MPRLSTGPVPAEQLWASQSLSRQRQSRALGAWFEIALRCSNWQRAAVCLTRIDVLNGGEGPCLCRHAGTELRTKRNIPWLCAISLCQPLAKLRSLHILSWVITVVVGTLWACGYTVSLQIHSFPFCLLPLLYLFGFTPDCSLSRLRTKGVYDGSEGARSTYALPNILPPGLSSGSWNLTHPHCISVNQYLCFGSAGPIWSESPSCPHQLSFGVSCAFVLNSVDSSHTKWKICSTATFSAGKQSKAPLKEIYYTMDTIRMSFSASKILLYGQISVGLHKLINYI